MTNWDVAEGGDGGGGAHLKLVEDAHGSERRAAIRSTHNEIVGVVLIVDDQRSSWGSREEAAPRYGRPARSEIHQELVDDTDVGAIQGDEDSTRVVGVAGLQLHTLDQRTRGQS